MSTQPVGSLTDEAAKLLAVLQGWAATAATDQEDASHAHTSDTPDGSGCRWCPHCRLVRAARATSPEARDHLTQAATAFALAVQELLATQAQTQSGEGGEGGAPVEKIDLAED